MATGGDHSCVPITWIEMSVTLGSLIQICLGPKFWNADCAALNFKNLGKVRS